MKKDKIDLELSYGLCHTGNKKEEYVLLNDFLYEAIYIPDGVEPPPKSIINCPELQEYVFEFGKRKDDRALVAEVQGNVVGGYLGTNNERLRTH